MLVLGQREREERESEEREEERERGMRERGRERGVKRGEREERERRERGERGGEREGGQGERGGGRERGRERERVVNNGVCLPLRWFYWTHTKRKRSKETLLREDICIAYQESEVSSVQFSWPQYLHLLSIQFTGPGIPNFPT
jgi:hypothetical protein